MQIQMVSSDCRVLRKMVRKFYPNLDKFGRDMMVGVICSMINNQYAPKVGRISYGGYSRYKTMMVDAQMIVNQYKMQQ